METRSSLPASPKEKTFLEKLFGPIQGSGIQAPEFWDRLGNAKVNTGAESVRQSDRLHREHFSTKIFLAAGFSTRNYIWDTKEGFGTNAWKTFTRWHHPTAPLWQRIINYTGIAPLLAVLWQVSMAVPKFAVNVLRPIAWALSMAVSAFLPLVIAYAAKKIIKSIIKTTFPIVAKVPLLFLPVVVAVATWPLAFVFKLIADVTFYPYETFKAYWEASRASSNGFFDQAIGIAKKAAAIFAVLLAIAIFTTLATLAAIYMPGFIVAGISAALASSGLAGITAAVFAPIGAAITGVLAPFFATAALSNTAIGFAVVAGATFGLVSSLGNYVAEKLGDWYHSVALATYLTKKLPTISTKQMDGDKSSVGLTHDGDKLTPLFKPSTSKTMQALTVQPEGATSRKPLFTDSPKTEQQPPTKLDSLNLPPLAAHLTQFPSKPSPFSTTIIHDDARLTLGSRKA